MQYLISYNGRQNQLEFEIRSEVLVRCLMPACLIFAVGCSISVVRCALCVVRRALCIYCDSYSLMVNP